MKASNDKITLGITDDEVPLGSHLIHFWQTDKEFERGVRFLELGIADEFQHCVFTQTMLPHFIVAPPSGRGFERQPLNLPKVIHYISIAFTFFNLSTRLVIRQRH